MAMLSRTLASVERRSSPMLWLLWLIFVQFSHLTTVSCSATSDLTRPPASHHLLVGFKVKGIERNVTYVEEGSIVQLQCEAWGYRSDVASQVPRIDWTLNGTLHQFERGYFSAIFGSSQSRDWFRAGAGFSGTIHCETDTLISPPIHIETVSSSELAAMSSRLPWDNSPWSISIHQLSHQLLNFVSKRGSFPRLECRAISARPFRVIWFFLSQAKHTVIRLPTTNPILVDNNQHRNHTGIYVCAADNGQRTTIAIFKIATRSCETVTSFLRDSGVGNSSQTLPDMKIIPVRSGCPIRLHCSAFSNPPATLSWFVNEVPILQRYPNRVLERTSLGSSVLTLSSVQPEDSGSLFQCSIVTGTVRLTRLFRIDVIDAVEGDVERTPIAKGVVVAKSIASCTRAFDGLEKAVYNRTHSRQEFWSEMKKDLMPLFAQAVVVSTVIVSMAVRLLSCFCRKSQYAGNRHAIIQGAGPRRMTQSVFF